MKIGYSLYSARSLITDPTSMEHTLKALATMGYDGVEFFTYEGTTPEQLRKILDETELTPISTHVHKPRWDADTQGEIEYAKAAGIPVLIYPWVAPEDRNEAFFAALPAYLEQLADKCAQAGIALQYHNHDFELAPMGDGRVIDVLLAGSDKFNWQMDTFWVEHAGVSAPKLLEQVQNRVKLIHIKDHKGTDEGGDPQIVIIGDGKQNNKEIIAAAARAGVEWVIVELDDTETPVLESAQKSIQAVRQMLAES